jgi:selenoprotein W-related protein
LKDALGIGARLIKGSGGIFDVVVDGRKVFSKHQTGRFPEAGEIVALLGKTAG